MIQPNCGHQVWQRREVHVLEKLALDLNGSSQGHPLSGPSLQCTEGETEAALQETLFAKVTQQVSALLRLRP